MFAQTVRPNFQGGTMPKHYFTSEEARAASKKGAAKRKEYYAKRRKMLDTLDILLRSSVFKSGKVLRPEEIQGIAEDQKINCDAQTAMLISVLQAAIGGDVDAAKFIRDTVGEKPSDKVEVDAAIAITDIILCLGY